MFTFTNLRKYHTSATYRVSPELSEDEQGERHPYFNRHELNLDVLLWKYVTLLGALRARDMVGEEYAPRGPR